MKMNFPNWIFVKLHVKHILTLICTDKVSKSVFILDILRVNQAVVVGEVSDLYGDVPSAFDSGSQSFCRFTHGVACKGCDRQNRSVNCRSVNEFNQLK